MSSGTHSLFLADAGIDFKDIRYAFDATWGSTSKSLQDQGLTLTGKLPTLDYKGHLLIQASIKTFCLQQSDKF
jgi:glutathione S-transferase